MLKNVVVDGDDNDYKLKVFKEGSIGVVPHRHPPINEVIVPVPFRQYFTDDGTATGSNDWTVDGSSTNVDFYVSALQDYDVYIKSISVVIGDGGSPALNKYGDLAALTNGIKLDIFNQEVGLYELHDGIKTNLEFVRLGVDTGAVGTGTDAYLADVSGGGTEKSYLPTIDLAETFGIPFGIRLRKGTTDRLVFTVRDDLTGITTHNAIAYGSRI
jgi:hypothetical protein